MSIQDSIAGKHCIDDCHTKRVAIIASVALTNGISRATRAGLGPGRIGTWAEERVPNSTRAESSRVRVDASAWTRIKARRICASGEQGVDCVDVGLVGLVLEETQGQARLRQMAQERKFTEAGGRSNKAQLLRPEPASKTQRSRHGRRGSNAGCAT